MDATDKKIKIIDQIKSLNHWTSEKNIDEYLAIYPKINRPKIIDIS